MELSQRLKMLREEHKLTQDELAVKLKVSRSTIANYESGFRVPEINMLHQICDIYNITLDSLFSDKIEYRKPKKNNRYKIIYSILFSLIISMLLVIVIPNINNEDYKYGYDINSDKLKVENCDEISVIKFKESIDKNTYKVDIHYSLKGNKFNYITIHNNDIKINTALHYLVFGNRIKFEDKNNNFATLDHIEIYDKQFIYELSDFDSVAKIDDTTTLSGNLINYYSYYVNEESKNDIKTLSFDNVRKDEIVISHRNHFNNHYDVIDLSPYNEFIKENREKDYNYIDIEISIDINIESNVKPIIYLYENTNDKSENKIVNYEINNNRYNHIIFDKVIFKFNSLPIDIFYKINKNLIIRYSYSSIFNSSWSNSNLNVKMEFRK